MGRPVRHAVVEEVPRVVHLVDEWIALRGALHLLVRQHRLP